MTLARELSQDEIGEEVKAVLLAIERKEPFAAVSRRR
jgi:hypothetical protein